MQMVAIVQLILRLENKKRTLKRMNTIFDEVDGPYILHKVTTPFTIQEKIKIVAQYNNMM